MKVTLIVTDTIQGHWNLCTSTKYGVPVHGTKKSESTTWKKVIEVSALNPNLQLIHSHKDPTLILLIRKLIITNSCFQVEAYCELAITFLPKIIWMVTNTEPCIRAGICILYWSLHLKTYKHTYLPCLDFLPSKNHNMSSQKMMDM